MNTRWLSPGPRQGLSNCRLGPRQPWAVHFRRQVLSLLSLPAQPALALLISWMLPRLGSSLPHFPTLEANGVKIETWRPLRIPGSVEMGRETFNPPQNDTLP